MCGSSRQVAFMWLGVWVAVVGVGVAAAEMEEIALEVYPAAEPRPALKYQLLPEFLDRTDGNAATLYLQALAQMELAGQEDPNLSSRLGEWVDQKPTEMPLDEVKRVLSERSVVVALRRLDQGARCRGCDWGVPIREEGLSVWMPSLGAIRALGRLNLLRARVAWRGGDFEGALAHLATGNQLARHTAEMPMLVPAMVGHNVIGGNLWELIDMSEAPGAPNLYWALVDLPKPIIPIRPALHGELRMLEMTYPLLTEIDRRPLSSDEWQGLLVELAHIDKRFTGSIWPPEDPAERERGSLEVATLVALSYPQARDVLESAGFPAKQVKAMSPQECVVRYWLHDYRCRQSDGLRWLAVPYHEAASHLWEIDQRTVTSEEDDDITLPAAVMCVSPEIPARSLALLNHRIAINQAIRAYVAAHGDLPATLDDVKDWPIPLDPIHGKPFEYSVDGDTFTLESAPPPNSDRTRLRLKVTIIRSGAKGGQ